MGMECPEQAQKNGHNLVTYEKAAVKDFLSPSWSF
jgi:hypothetical protein